MTRLPLPPIDAHAHVDLSVSPEDLQDLETVVFAVTREPREWARVAARRDELTIWGIGCHPELEGALAGFSQEDFAEAIQRSALVGEIGLDGRAATSMDDQRRVFDQILAVTHREPRVLSIHSRWASGQVLDTLDARPQQGAILHWWRGSRDQTARAIEMGCYFSISGAETRRPRVLRWLPRDRVLTETDFPFTQRADREALRPGAVGTPEKALAHEWETDLWGVRRQLWVNLRELLDRTDCFWLMPRGVTKALFAIPE